MKRSRLSTAAFALALLIAVPAPLFAQAQAQPPAPSDQSQVPQPNEGGVNWSGAGYGAAAVLCNVVYIPVKVVYALLGGIVGGGTWALTGGNTQVANTVWRSSFGGDYVVTPDMLQGKQPINFSGPTETAPENPVAAAPAPAPSMNEAAAPSPSALSAPLDKGSGSGPSEKSIE
jgi:hypothetical protein